jgi:hypothetical protein
MVTRQLQVCRMNGNFEMTPVLIGLNGFKHVGKSTVGDYLTEKYDFEQAAFADKMKQAVAALWGIPVEMVNMYKDEVYPTVAKIDKSIWGTMQLQSWRTHLQKFGEMGRGIFGEDFWVNQLIPKETLFLLWKPLVITDARMENELVRIRYLEGYNIRIIRPGCEPDGHDTEVEPPAHLIDYTINNNTTISDLYETVDEVLDLILKVHSE